MRIGIGYDIHKLVKERKLVLGGVHIPYTKGLLGHSDADVLLHSICDALLGACGEGDIGTHFPNTDITYKDISSLELLKRVGVILNTKKFKIVNIDSVIILEAPKVSSYINNMKQNIADTLDIPLNSIGIKATTNEGIGSIGRGEGIASYAIVLVTA